MVDFASEQKPDEKVSLFFCNKKGGEWKLTQSYWVATRFQRQNDPKKKVPLNLYFIRVPKIITFQRRFLFDSTAHHLLYTLKL